MPSLSGDLQMRTAMAQALNRPPCEPDEQVGFSDSLQCKRFAAVPNYSFTFAPEGFGPTMNKRTLNERDIRTKFIPSTEQNILLP